MSGGVSPVPFRLSSSKGNPLPDLSIVELAVSSSDLAPDADDSRLSGTVSLPELPRVRYNRQPPSSPPRPPSTPRPLLSQMPKWWHPPAEATDAGERFHARQDALDVRAEAALARLKHPHDVQQAKAFDTSLFEIQSLRLPIQPLRPHGMARTSLAMRGERRLESRGLKDSLQVGDGYGAVGVRGRAGTRGGWGRHYGGDGFSCGLRSLAASHSRVRVGQESRVRRTVHAEAPGVAHCEGGAVEGRRRCCLRSGYPGGGSYPGEELIELMPGSGETRGVASRDEPREDVELAVERQGAGGP